MDPSLLITISIVIGIFLAYWLVRDRIDGHPAVIALLVAATIWMAYEAAVGPRDHRVFRIILAFFYASGAWKHWTAHREGRWTAYSLRDDSRSR